MATLDCTKEIYQEDYFIFDAEDVVLNYGFIFNRLPFTPAVTIRNMVNNFVTLSTINPAYLGVSDNRSYDERVISYSYIHVFNNSGSNMVDGICSISVLSAPGHNTGLSLLYLLFLLLNERSQTCCLQNCVWNHWSCLGGCYYVRVLFIFSCC